jgi:hypothetical protein
MVDLTQDWLTDGHIDLEYKKYLLLAYLQQVDEHFAARRLYPPLAELIDHYRQLAHFRSQKAVLAQQFPKEISAIDLAQYKLLYRSMTDSDMLQVLDEIVDFAMPQIHERMDIGRELYEEAETGAKVITVGIQPLHTDEGYLLLHDYLTRMIHVYYYQLSIYESAEGRYRGIHTRWVSDYTSSISNTYEHIKYELAHTTVLTTPATYAMEFRDHYPLQETMLPVAKRLLVKYIAA